MKTMKKNYFIALLALICNFAFAQIEQVTYRGAFAPSVPMWTDTWTNYNPGNTEYADATVVNVSGTISANTTWTADKTYKLNGLVYVTNNATLTIEPGVVVKGVNNSNGTALIITKGAKINAVGTAANPIVFTSAKTVAQGRQPGDWGGVILLGKAGFNINGGINYIEGITSNANTQYGGGSTPNDADNSGTLKYVRIEYAGFVFSPNNEINGLTLGAVGSGTTIDYVQVSYANDDAFEWFGGAVNCKHLVSYRNLDDDFDTDNGFKGSVQFGLILRDPSLADNPAISTSEGFESDNNPNGDASPVGSNATSATFSNITAIGPKVRASKSPSVSVASGYERALRIRRRSELKIINSIFMDFKKNYLFVDGATTVDNAKVLKLKFKNNIMAGSSDGVAEFTGGVNFAGTSGSVVYPGLKLNNTGDDITPNAWFTGNGNTVQASSSNLLELAYNATTSTYEGLDYRPKTDSPALTGADFTGFVSTPVTYTGETPVVANVIYCKGAIAAPLTATLAGTGTDLKFYTRTGTTTATYRYTAVTGTALTPLTTTVGVKTYYVTQMNGTTESAKVEMTVTVNALPTTALSPITGEVVNGTAGTVVADVTSYVGTTTEVIYQVALTAADTAVTGYTWNVPAGVTINSGQGTTQLKVNFKNVAPGVLALGNITVQAKNANNCLGTAVKVALTAKLPNAPTTLVLADKNGASPVVITNYATKMGTTTPLTLSTGTVANATSYDWELPAGVTVSIPAGVSGVSTSETYTALPFLSTNSAPSTVGTKFWVVSKTAYTYDVNGVATTTTISTCEQKIMGSYSSGVLVVETPKLYEFAVSGTLATAVPAGATFTYSGKTYTVRTAVTTGSSKKIVCTTSSSNLNATDSTLAGNLVPAVGSTYTGTDIAFAGFKYTSNVINYGPTTSAPYAQYGTKVSSNKPAILVNLADVTSASTTALYFGVIAKNGVGYKTVDNTTNTDVVANATSIPGLFNRTYTETFTAPVNSGGPSSTTQSGRNAISTYTATGYEVKTSKLLKLVATVPAAPASVKATAEGNSTTAVTDISKYISQDTALTLTAAPSALATSYEWELPAGVNLTSGSLGTQTDRIVTSTSNVITVRFNGVGTGISSLYLGVKGVNRIGGSSTNNSALTPATTSTYKLLKLTATVPAAATALVGDITNLVCGATKSYTFTASAKALNYTITAPTGSVVTATDAPNNATNSVITATNAFTVTYPSTFAITSATSTADKSLVIRASNGVGNNVTDLTKALTTAAFTGTISAHTSSTTTTALAKFKTCQVKNIAVPAFTGASSYVWTVANGAVITDTDQTTRTINVDFSAVTVTSTVITVKAINSCGISSTVKTITLTKENCMSATNKIIDENTISLVSNTEMYPNPATDVVNFNIDATSNGVIEMTIYSLDGKVVMESKGLTVENGANSFTENVSNLNKGIYLVRITNSTSNEVITKKLIKN